MKIRHWRTGEKDWNAPQARDAGGRYVRRVLVRDERVWTWRADRRTMLVLLFFFTWFVIDQALWIANPWKVHAATTVLVNHHALTPQQFCTKYGDTNADSRAFCGL